MKEKAGARDVIITRNKSDVITVAPGLYLFLKKSLTEKCVCGRRVRALFETDAATVAKIVICPKIVETCLSLRPAHSCDIATSEYQEGVVGRSTLECSDGCFHARM